MDLFRCVTGIPGKNQVIAVLNSRSEPPPRKDLRSTLDMTIDELKVLFRGFLQASRKRADEVRLSEHHGNLRSKKEFHVHFIFSGSDFAEVCPVPEDRFKIQDMETSRKAKLLKWVVKDLEICKGEISKAFLPVKLATGPTSDVVHMAYHTKYARISFSTSCDFFGFSRSFAFVKEYIRHFELKNFHLIVSYDHIQIAMTCDEYVKHLLSIKGVEWVRTWVSEYERAFAEGDLGTVLDS